MSFATSAKPYPEDFPGDRSFTIKAHQDIDRAIRGPDDHCLWNLNLLHQSSHGFCPANSFVYLEGDKA